MNDSTRPKKQLFKPDKSLLEPDPDFIGKNRISLDISYMINGVDSQPFILIEELDKIAPKIIEYHQMLKEGEGDCKDGETSMLGWQSLPEEITIDHLDSIQAVADQLSERIDIFLSLGIGGSYLGVEATVKALKGTYYNQLSEGKRNNRPAIYFLGQNVDPDFLYETLDLIGSKNVGLNVISKSGTTTETAIAFRLLKNQLEKKYGSSASEYIIATTDSTKGALRKLADQNGYKTFTVPDNVGGRFSVLTDVGLFGLAVAGINIYEFVAGFYQMKQLTDGDTFWSNLSMVHSAIRYLSHKKGKKIEVVATNSTALYQLTRWMEQLFPESEGHGGYGMWVSPSMYSEKLHANGQMVQDGERNIIETFLRLENFDNEVEIPLDKDNLDGLNYLPENGKMMNSLNQIVIDGPAYAHFKGGVPNITLNIPRRNAFNLGQFYYMMERSVALSGYLAGHNPFIQPGVEDYKKAMFALAGKPGSEEYGKDIINSINRIDKKVIR